MVWTVTRFFALWAGYCLALVLILSVAIRLPLLLIRAAEHSVRWVINGLGEQIEAIQGLPAPAQKALGAAALFAILLVGSYIQVVVMKH